jgi:hypothetical protein
MARNFETTFSRQPYGIPQYIDEAPIDFTNPPAVAECLVDNGDYDGYTHDLAFSEADVFQLALEDAADIIKKRDNLLRARELQRLTLETTVRSIHQRNIWESTRYVVVSTPVDQLRQIS